MGISDLIAGFIQDALDEANGVLELQRSDLAQRFGCVPSQINYVMSTRFSPEHGYIVESRRGGGGYIRIRRVQMDRQTLLMHVINSIGGELDGAAPGPFSPTWPNLRPWRLRPPKQLCALCPTVPCTRSPRTGGTPCGRIF